MFWVKAGAAMMFLVVLMGSFGGHAFKARLTAYGLDVYKTAVMYHALHALGLFVVAWVSTINGDERVALAGWSMLWGILFFSGSLYLLALTQIKIFGAFTPIGGMLFLVAWALLFLTRMLQ